MNQHKDGPFFLYVPTAHMHVPHLYESEWEGVCNAGVFGSTLSEEDHTIGRIFNETFKLGI